MVKFIIIYSYHDTYVEYFNNIEELKNRYYELLNQYSNYSDFHCKIYKISGLNVSVDEIIEKLVDFC